MGFEEVSSPSTIQLHLTGFKKFYNVDENPTELLVQRVTEMVQNDRAMPSCVKIESCTVLETAGAGARDFLLNLLDSSCVRSSEKTPITNVGEPGASRIQLQQPDAAGMRSSEKTSNTDVGDSEACRIQHRQADFEAASKVKVVWVHFGVKSGASGFDVEKRAVNEASFRCPDEMGWQPYGEPIVEEDGGISVVRETDFPMEKIVATLLQQQFDVLASQDAGRFVCNYVYYLSLRHAARHGHRSLFVHVPPFSVKDLHSQLDFVAALLKVLASCCSQSELSEPSALPSST